MVDISNLTFAELNQLQTQITNEIAKRRLDEKKRLASEFKRLANESGLDLEEIMGQATAGKAVKVTGQAKYANPQDKSLTWTGRGRKPQWVVDFLASGGDLEQLAI